MNVQDITRDCHIFLIRCVHYNLAGAFALGKDVEAVPCGSFKAEYSAFGGELGTVAKDDVHHLVIERDIVCKVHVAIHAVPAFGIFSITIGSFAGGDKRQVLAGLVLRRAVGID